MESPDFINDAVLFSVDVPDAVNTILQAAVITARSDKRQAEKLFIQAYQRIRIVCKAILPCINFISIRRV